MRLGAAAPPQRKPKAKAKRADALARRRAGRPLGPVKNWRPVQNQPIRAAFQCAIGAASDCFGAASSPSPAHAGVTRKELSTLGIGSRYISGRRAVATPHDVAPSLLIFARPATRSSCGRATRESGRSDPRAILVVEDPPPGRPSVAVAETACSDCAAAGDSSRSSDQQML
jgi:hypothetical protein